MNHKILLHNLKADIRRQRGTNEELIAEIDQMSPEAVVSLYEILRDQDREIARLRTKTRNYGLGS